MLDVRPLALLLGEGGRLVLAAADNEDVRRGGEILGRGWAGRTHPFYDSKTDDVRLIPVEQPPTPSNWSFDPRLVGYIVLGVLGILLILILIFFIRRIRTSQNAGE